MKLITLKIFPIQYNNPFFNRSYTESSRVDYCIGNIFNVISFMITTKHPVLHMQFFNWACIPEDGQF
jgi:hypothetical protein